MDVTDEYAHSNRIGVNITTQHGYVRLKLDFLHDITPNAIAQVSGTNRGKGLYVKTGNVLTGSNFFEIVGTLVDIQTLLIDGNVLYCSSDHTYSDDFITFSASVINADYGKMELQDTPVTRTIEVNLEKEITIPRIVADDLIYTDEDQVLPVSIQLKQGDNEASAMEYNVDIVTSHGFLNISNGKCHEGSTAGVRMLSTRLYQCSVNGSMIDINNALDTLTYSPMYQYNKAQGLDTISATLYEKGVVLTESETTVVVNPVNHAPVISAYSHVKFPLLTDQNIPRLLSDIFDIDDSDVSDMLTLSFMASHGNIMILNPSKLLKLNSTSASDHITSTNTSALTIRGNMHKLKRVIDTLWYDPHVNYTGLDNIMATLCDSSNVSVSLSVPILMNKVDIPPTIGELPRVLWGNEDTPLSLPPIVFRDYDLLREHETYRVEIGQMIGKSSAPAGIIIFNSSTVNSLGNEVLLNKSKHEGYVVIGNLLDLNQLFSDVKYVPASDSNIYTSEYVMLTISIEEYDIKTSLVISGSSTRQIKLYFHAIDDAATINVGNSTLVVSEDDSVSLGSSKITISDVDFSELVDNRLLVTLTVHSGALSTDASLVYNDLIIKVLSKPRDMMRQIFLISASIDEINRVMQHVVYTPPRDFYGNDFIDIVISQEKVIPNSMNTPFVPSESTISVQVLPTNDAPVIYASSLYRSKEDSAVQMSGISIDDVDFATFDSKAFITVTLTAKYGMITVTSYAVIFLSGNNTVPGNTVTVQGPILGMNTALESLVYSPATNYHGIDEVQILVSDNGILGVPVTVLTTTRVVYVFVSSIDDGSTINYTSEEGVMANTSKVIESHTPETIFNNILFNDADNTDSNICIIHVTCDQCTWDTSSISISMIRNSSTSLYISGSINRLQKAIESIKYVGISPSDTSDIVSISFVDSKNLSHVLSESFMYISIVGRAMTPSINSGVSIIISEDTPLAIGASALNLVVDYDHHLDALACKVRVYYDSSVISIQVPVDVPSSKGVSDTSAVMSISIPHCGQLSTVIDAINIIPTENYNSVAYIQNNTGVTLDVVFPASSTVGDTKSTTISHRFTVFVTPVDDEPIIDAPSRASTSEDLPLYLDMIHIHDSDITRINDLNSRVMVNFSVLYGALHAPSTANHVTIYPSKSKSTMQVVGTLANINSFLPTMSYVPGLDWSGIDTMSIQVVSTMKGLNSMSDIPVLSTISIDVLPINDLPVIALSSSSINIQQDKEFYIFDDSKSGIEVEISDVDTSLLSVNVTVSSGHLYMDNAISAGDTIVINATSSDIINALKTICYKGPGGVNIKNHGLVTLYISVSDGSKDFAKSKLYIVLTPVNVAPVITAPSSITASLIRITGDDSDNLYRTVYWYLSSASISVSDNDSHLVDVTVSIQPAPLTKMSFNNISAIGYNIVHVTDFSVRVQCKLKFVQDIMNRITYEHQIPYDKFPVLISSIGGYTAATLQVTVSDMNLVGPTMHSSTTVTKYIPLVLLDSFVVYDEQTDDSHPNIRFMLTQSGSLSTGRIVRSTEGVTDVPISSFIIDSVHEWSVLHVTLSIEEYMGLLLISSHSTDPSHTISIQGTAKQLNGLLSSLTYIPRSHYNGIAAVSASLSILDAIDSSKTYSVSSTSAKVYLESVNDPPSLSLQVPSALSGCKEHQVCYMELYISDPDASDSYCKNDQHSSMFTVTLHSSVSPTVFTILHNSGIYFSPNSTDDTVILFCPVGKCNNHNLQFGFMTPVNWFGDISMTATVSDNGRCGTKATAVQANVESTELKITCESVNNPPVLQMVDDTDIVCVEDTLCTMPTIIVDDVDLKEYQASLVVAINITHGALAMSTLSTMLPTSPENNEFVRERVILLHNYSSSISFTSQNISALQNIMDAITILPDTNFNGMWPDTGVIERISGVYQSDSLLQPLDTVLSRLDVTVSDGTTVVTLRKHVSVSWRNDPPIILGPSGVNVSENVANIFKDFIIDDYDRRDGAHSDMPMNVTIECLDSITTKECMLSLPLLYSIRAGVEYVGNNDMKTSSVLLVGTVAAIQKSLQYIEFHGNLVSTSTVDIKITAHDNGNFGLGTPLSVAKIVTVTLNYGNLRGISILDTRDSGGVYNVDSGSGVVLDSLRIEIAPFKQHYDDEKMTMIIAANKYGDVVSTTSQVKDEMLSKVFDVDVIGNTESTPEVQVMSIEMPWRYEKQAIEMYSDVTITDTIDVGLVFDCYNVTYNTTFSVVTPIEHTVFNVRAALSEIDSIGDIVVSYLAPNSTSPSNLLGTIYVTFTSNAYDIPLIRLTHENGTFSTSVVEVEKGTLLPAVVAVSANTTGVIDGEFIMVLPRKLTTAMLTQYAEDNTYSSRRIETSALPYNASSDDVRNALLNIGMGYTDVQRTDDPQGITVWTITFLTRLFTDNIIVLTSAGSTDATYAKTECGITTCRSITNTVTNNSMPFEVELVTPATVPVGGNLKLGIVSQEGGSDVISTSIDINLDHNEAVYAIKFALKSLRGVLDADVKAVYETMEKRNKYVMKIWCTNGSIPTLAPQMALVVGTGVNVYIERASKGNAPIQGTFQLALSDKKGNVGKTSSIAIDASVRSVSKILDATWARMNPELHLDFDVERNIISSTITRYTIAVKLVPYVTHDALTGDVYVTSDGSTISLASRDDIPSIVKDDELSNLKGTGSDIMVLERSLVDMETQVKARRHLLSIEYPLYTDIAEVQTLYCSSTSAVPTEWNINTTSPAEFLHLSYRGFEVSPIWIFDYVESSQLPECAVTATGLPCKTDKSTVFDKLMTTKSINNIRVISNSTTGRLCPSVGDVDDDNNPLVFATNITFVGGNDDEIKISNACIGDVPLILIDTNTSTYGSNTVISIAETLKGSTSFIQEVQKLSIGTTDGSVLPSAGVFNLHYNYSTTTISIHSTEYEFAFALASLISNKQSSSIELIANSIRVKKVLSLDESINTWYVTFPTLFGRAYLIQATDNCIINGTSSAHGQTTRQKDHWSGYSCLLSFDNFIQSSRIVAGQSPLSGDLVMNVEASSFSVPLVWLEKDLQTQIRKISGLELATITNIKNALTSSSYRRLFLIDYMTNSYPLTTVSVHQVQRHTHYCIKDGNRCVFPFIYDNEQYSECAGDISGNSYSFCATKHLYDYTKDSDWGVCTPCAGQFKEQYISLLPTKNMIRFEGNMEQLQDAISSLVYIPSTELVIEQTQAMSSLTDYVTIIVEDPGSDQPVESEVKIILNLVNNPPSIHLRSDKIHVFEDTIAYMNNMLIISDPNYPSLLSQSKGYVSVSLAVSHGDIFLGQYVGISFADINIVGNLTFSGTIYDVNRALKSLIYQPFGDWNSIMGKPHVNPRQRITISSSSRVEKQQIRITLPDTSGIIAVNDYSYFSLELDCNAFARNISSVNQVIVPQFTSVFTTQSLSPVASENDMKREISRIFDACSNMLDIAPVTSGNVSNNYIDINVTRQAVDPGKNLYAWELSFIPWKYMKDGFPQLQVKVNNITTINSLGSVGIEIRKERRILPSGQFTIGINGENTVPIDVMASSEDVAEALESLNCINNVIVTKSIINDAVKERVGVVYDVEFVQDTVWTTTDNFNILSSGIIENAPVFGPLYNALDIDSNHVHGSDMTAEVSVVSLGFVDHDTLSIVVNDFGLNAATGIPDKENEEMVAEAIAIYVVPQLDMPRIETLVSNIRVKEDTPFAIRGSEISSVDHSIHDSVATFTLSIYTPYGKVQFLQSDNSVDLVSESVIQTSGPLSILSHLISDILYIPSSDYCGTTSIRFSLTLTNSSNYAASVTTVAVDIECIVDTASILFASNYSVVSYDTPSFIGDMILSDPDSIYSEAIVYVNMTVSKGILLAPTLKEFSPGEYIPVTWESGSTIQLRGSLVLLNNIIKFMKYKGTQSDQLEVVFTTPTSSANGILPIKALTNTDMIDRVSIAHPKNIVHIPEDTPNTPLNVSIAFNGSGDSMLDVVVSCDSGVVRVNPFPGHMDTVVQKLSEGPVAHLRSASLKLLNVALSGMYFVPVTNFNGLVSIDLSIMSDPKNGISSTVTAQIYIFVDEVDDEPTIAINSQQVSMLPTHISSPISLQSIFKVHDVDDINMVMVELQCDTGSLSMSRAFLDQELTDEFHASAMYSMLNYTSSFLTFFANKDYVSSILDYLIYTPAKLYAGHDNVSLNVTSLVINANNNSYIRGKFASSVLKLNVKMSSIIQWNCPRSINMREDDSVDLQHICSLQSSTVYNSTGYTVSLTLSIIDVDVSIGYFRVTDTILLDSRFDWSLHSILQGGMANKYEFTFLSVKMSVSDIDLFLSQVTCHTSDNKHGNYIVSVVAVLETNTAVSAHSLASSEIIEAYKEIKFTILPVNDPPYFVVDTPSHVIGGVYILNQTDTLPLTFITVEDIDLSETPLAYLNFRCSAIHGSCRVSASAKVASIGVYVVDDGYSSGMVHLMGRDTDITSLLSTGLIEYVPSKQLVFASEDNVTLIINDNGFSGIETVKGNSSTLLVPIEVLPQLEPLSLVLNNGNVLVGYEDSIISFYDLVQIETGSFDANIDVISLSIDTRDGLLYCGTLESVNVTSSGNRVTLFGTIASVQSVFISNYTGAGCRFVPSADLAFSLQASFTIDYVNNGVSNTIENTLKMYLIPVNDAPVINKKTNAVDWYEVVNKETLDFSSNVMWQITDSDITQGPALSQRGKITVNVSTPCGLLQFEPTGQLWVLTNAGKLRLSIDSVYPVDEAFLSHDCIGVTGRDSATNVAAPVGYKLFTFDGDLATVNAALLSLRYIAPSSNSGISNITLSVSDNGNFGLDNSQVHLVSDTLHIKYHSAQVFPSIVMSHNVTIQEHSTFFGSEVKLRVVNSQYSNEYRSVFTMTVSTVVNVNNMNAYHVPIIVPLKFQQNSSSGDDSIQIVTSTLPELLEIFDELLFKVPMYLHGVISVQVSITENGATFSGTTMVVVEPVVDPIAIISSDTNLTEDVPSFVPFTIVDEDTQFLIASNSDLYRLYPTKCCDIELYVSCTHCFFTTTTSSGVSNSFTITSDFNDLNLKLKQILVTGDQDYSGEAFIHVKITQFAEFMGENSYSAHNITLNIRGVDDPPGVVYRSGNQGYYISNSDERYLRLAQAIEIIDKDSVSGSETLTVSVSSRHGKFSFRDTSSRMLNSNINTTNDESVTFQALLSDVNFILSDLYYTPYRNFAGNDVISIRVADASGYSDGKLTVTVKYMNNPPEVDLLENKNLSIMENEVLNLTAIQVSDADRDLIDANGRAEHLSVIVRGAHSGRLEIQEVTVASPHRDQRQTVTIVSASDTHVITGGYFELSIDLSVYDLGVFTTNKIYYGAANNEMTERTNSDRKGGKSGESIESIINSISGLKKLGVTVSVYPSGFPVINTTASEIVQYELVFHNTNYTFPVLSVASNMLHTSTGTGSNHVHIDVRRSVPVNELGGTFTLSLSSYSTKSIPFNASAELMAAALEELPSVDLVSVTRSNYGDNHGFSWTVTFFSTGESSLIMSSNSDVPELIGNADGLIGDIPINTPDMVQIDKIRPTVVVRTIQDGVGRPSVYSLTSRGTHINETISITIQSYDVFTERFYLNVTSKVGEIGTIGPIYLNTVAMTADEIHGVYPPHAQAAGTESSSDMHAVGSSMQSMILNLPFLSNYASNVLVQKVTMSIATATSNLTSYESRATVKKVTWRVTFLDAKETDFTYTVDTSYSPFALHETTLVTVKTVTAANKLGGTFVVSYGGYNTAPLSYDCSAEALESALIGLPSVHDNILNIGRVVVGRRGPDNINGYTWIICFVEEPEISYDGVIPVESLVDLSGIGANLRAKTHRKSAADYGFRLSRQVGGVSATTMTVSLLKTQSVLAFKGTPLAVSKALGKVQYLPAANWFGSLRIIIRVQDLQQPNKDTVIRNNEIFPFVDTIISEAAGVIDVNVYDTNNAPIILWRDAEITHTSMVDIYEDTDVILGNSLLFYSSDHVLQGSSEYFDPRMAGKGNKGIQIYDDDAGIGVIIVTLSAKRGYLSVATAHTNRGVYTNVVVEVNRLNISYPDLKESQAAMAGPGETINISGDMHSINSLLRTLKYQSDLNDIGVDYINITAYDNGHSGYKFINQSTTALLRVNIVPKNDAPVIALVNASLGTLYDNESSWEVGVVHMKEDGIFSLGEHFSIDDVDISISTLDIDHDFSYVDPDLMYQSGLSLDSVYVSVEVTYGTLQVVDLGTVMMMYNASRELTNIPITNPPAHPTLTGIDTQHWSRLSKSRWRGTRSRGLYLQGRFSEMQTALSSLKYIPDPDWNGVDTCVIYINDLGNIGVDGPKDLTRYILIDVEAVADVPLITTPEYDTLTTVEDTIGIIGSDCCNWTYLNYGKNVYNISEASMQITDHDLYMVVHNSSRVVVRNNTGYKDAYNTNDEMYQVTYGSPSLSDKAYYMYDYRHYNHTTKENNYTLVLNVSHGTLTMVRVPDTLKFVHGAGFLDDYIVVQGTLDDVNRCLKGLNYKPDINWNSQQAIYLKALSGINGVSDTLVATVTDSTGMSTSSSIRLFVKPANDPPVVSIGSLTKHDPMKSEYDQISRLATRIEPLVCQENSLCPILDLQMRDVDALDAVNAVVQVTLTCAKGSFSISHAMNKLSYYVDQSYLFGGNSNPKILKLNIPVVDIVTSLDGIMYRPEKDYYGHDQIIVDVDDMGNTGYGALCVGLEELKLPCRLTDSITIPVTIEGKADRVEIIIPETKFYRGIEDTDLHIQGITFIHHERIPLLKSGRWENPTAANHTFSLVSNYTKLNNSDSKVFKLDISSDAGRLSFAHYNNSGLDYIISSGIQASHISVKGNVYSLNQAIRSLIFHPTSNTNFVTNGIGKITLVITDILPENIKGVKPDATTTAELHVVLEPVNDAPVLTVPGQIYRIDPLETGKHVPVVMGVRTVYIEEDSEWSLAGIHIVDYDDGESLSSFLMEITISASHGVFFSYNRTAMLAIQTSSGTQLTSTDSLVHGTVESDDTLFSQFSEIVLKGRRDELNSNLAHIVYRPYHDYHGEEAISVKICDACFSDSLGRSCALCDNKTVPFRILSVNDAPVLVVPRAPITTGEDESFTFGGSINIFDVDSVDNDLLLKINVEYGVLTLVTVPTNLTILVGTGDHDQELQLVGSYEKLNIALRDMMYTPVFNWNSVKSGLPDLVSLYADDLGNSGEGYNSTYLNNTDVSNSHLGLTAVGELLILVKPGVNHAPYVRLPGAEYREYPCYSQDGQESDQGQFPYTQPRFMQCNRTIAVAIYHIAEDVPTVVSGVSIGDVDNVDNEFYTQSNFLVNVTANHGMISIPGYLAYGIHMIEGKSSGDPSITFAGSFANINKVLSTLTYTSPANYYGPDFISVYVNDEAYSTGGKSSNETIPVYVDQVDDSPEITVPVDILEVLEDTPMAIFGISITDNDFYDHIEGHPTYSRSMGEEDTYPYAKDYTWNQTMIRTIQSGLLSLSVTCNHCQFMFASTIGLTFIGTTNVTEESVLLNLYPDGT